MSGFFKSAVFPERAETAFPTSRFISAFSGSGSRSERSLQTISSLSATSGGTFVPIRKVSNSMPSTASTTLFAQSSARESSPAHIQQESGSGSRCGSFAASSWVTLRALPRSSFVSPNDRLPKKRPRQWLQVSPYPRIASTSCMISIRIPSGPSRLRGR